MTHIFLLLGLLILSGFFSGAEIALFSLSREKLAVAQNTATDKQKRWFDQLEKMTENPHRTLVLILLCNNVVNILASSIATVVALGAAQNMGLGIPESAVLAAVTAIMTFAILLFGEITPKALAHQHSLKFGLVAARVLWGLNFVVGWLVTPLAKVTEKIVGQHEQAGLTEEEIKAAINLTDDTGGVSEAEQELVEKVLELDDYRVESVMTPRSKMFRLDANTPLEEALKHIVDRKFSRIPIYKNKPDNIIGVIHIHELLEFVVTQSQSGKTLGDVHASEPIRVPPSMHADEVLRLLQTPKTSHMAFIVSADAELLGLVTMEDVLEEVFGEIQDETDDERLGLKWANGALVCKGETELEKVEDAVQQRFEQLKSDDTPWPREGENESIRHWLVEELQHFPAAGEQLKTEQNGWAWAFTASRVAGETVQEVTVEVTAPVTEQD